MGGRQQPTRACKRKMEHGPAPLESNKKAKSITCPCEIDPMKLMQSDLTQDQNPTYMTGPNIRKDNLDFLCDITIRSNDGKEHRAHKILLCSLGRKFESIHLENNEEGFINLNVSNETLEQILASVYKGSCDFNDTNMLEIGQFAKEFGTTSIQKHFGDHVLSKMHPGNALSMDNIAKSLLCPRIAGMTRLFILQNFKEINRMTDDMFGTMPVEELMSILRDDKLNTSEEELFLAMEKWAGEDEQRLGAVVSILHVVRFTLMSAEFFNGKVITSDLAKDPRFDKKLNTSKAYFHNLGRPKRKCAIFRGAIAKEKFRIPNSIILTSGGLITGFTPEERWPKSHLQTYNIRLNRWKSIDWGQRWANHGMVAINHVIYMFGGFDGQSHVRRMICLDLISGQLLDCPNMSSRRCYVSATECGGKIYALGGARNVVLPTGANETQRLATAEVFDPKSNGWTMLPPMNRMRSDACAVSYAGKVFILGGWEFDNLEFLNSIEIYDPNTQEWTYGPSMLSRRSGLKAVVNGRKIYAVGGYDGTERLSSVECLDPHAAPHKPHKRALT